MSMIIQTIDVAMIDQLKSIGIEKGKSFNPDPRTQDVSGGVARTTKALELPARPSSVFAPRAVRLCARSNGQGKQSQHLLECCLNA
jgi:hypothetical protein